MHGAHWIVATKRMEAENKAHEPLEKDESRDGNRKLYYKRMPSDACIFDVRALTQNNNSTITDKNTNNSVCCVFSGWRLDPTVPLWRLTLQSKIS
jgi:hypothetical protein